MALLEVKDLKVYYGVIQALKGISFHVDKGEIVALIGSNGAGKTTTLHTLSGLLQPRSGEILYNGKNITKVPGHKIVSMGMAQVPEGRRVFPDLTVAQNLRLGAYSRKDQAETEASFEYVYKRFPRLKEREDQAAETFSGGEQQMLAIARGLMCRPKLLMIDEMSLGLAPVLVDKVMDSLKEIRLTGITVLIVEQKVKEALELADRGYVLATGRIVQSGTSAELLESDIVKKAYLGM